MEPRVPKWSHPRFCPRARWPRFPALLGNYDFPAPHALRLLIRGVRGRLHRFRVRQSDCRLQASRRARSLGHPDLHFNGQMRDLPGCLATHPMTSRRSRDPGRPVAPRRDGASGAAPGNATARASSLELSGLNSGALSSPVYASRPGCRWPCKTRFRLAGCAFAGRESNPLGCDERFQFISSSFPDLRLALCGFASAVLRIQTQATRNPVRFERCVEKGTGSNKPDRETGAVPITPAPGGLVRTACGPRLGPRHSFAALGRYEPAIGIEDCRAETRNEARSEAREPSPTGSPPPLPMAVRTWQRCR